MLQFCTWTCHGHGGHSHVSLSLRASAGRGSRQPPSSPGDSAGDTAGSQQSPSAAALVCEGLFSRTCAEKRQKGRDLFLPSKYLAVLHQHAAQMLSTGLIPHSSGTGAACPHSHPVSQPRGLHQWSRGQARPAHGASRALTQSFPFPPAA